MGEMPVSSGRTQTFFDEFPAVIVFIYPQVKLENYDALPSRAVAGPERRIPKSYDTRLRCKSDLLRFYMQTV
jgi:hypothetical protein